MNKQRRKDLAEIMDRIEALKKALAAVDTSDLASICEDLTTLKDEEEEYKDNMPESMQGSDKHSTAENAVNELESAIEKLEEVRDFFDELDFDAMVSSIEEARGAA